MKNIFKRALALTMIAALFAVSAFAAPAISNVSYDESTGKLAATVSGYNSGDMATILVLKKGATLASATESDIVYINQTTADSEGKVTYSVPVKDRVAAVSATSVNLYVGGEDVTEAVPYKVEGTTADITIGSTTPTPTPVVTYAASVPAGTYNTIDAAIAALVVTKTTDGVPATLTTADYTTSYTNEGNVYTISVKVDGSEVTSTTVTITPTVDPEPSGKTGIKGLVKRRAMGANYSVATGALVLVANGTTISGAAVVESDGSFEIEVPAGTYRVIVRYALLSATGVTNYANTVFTNVTVADGALTTVNSDSKEFVAVERRLTGDANDDGTVTTADLDAVKSGLAG